MTTLTRWNTLVFQKRVRRVPVISPQRWSSRHQACSPTCPTCCSAGRPHFCVCNVCVEVCTIAWQILQHVRHVYRVCSVPYDQRHAKRLVVDGASGHLSTASHPLCDSSPFIHNRPPVWLNDRYVYVYIYIYIWYVTLCVYVCVCVCRWTWSRRGRCLSSYLWWDRSLTVRFRLWTQTLSSSLTVTTYWSFCASSSVRTQQ